jgi:hypothetical protein
MSTFGRDLAYNFARAPSLGEFMNKRKYNVDHQELAQEYEGKRVRIKGTLVSDGKTLHGQQVVPTWV